MLSINNESASNKGDLHRQIEKLPNVERFLSSLKRNSLNTSNGYKTPIAYFHEFLLSNAVFFNIPYHFDNCTLEAR